MPVFSGNTTGSIHQVAYNIPSGVMSFSLVMNSAGNLYLSIGNNTDGYVKIFTGEPLGTGDKVYNDAPIRVLAGSNIFLLTSGSCDYYFSIE